MPFSLRPDLHYCIANGRVVLLDLAKDRYFGLPDAMDEAFQSCVASGGDLGEDIPGTARLIAQDILRPTPDALPWRPAARLRRPTQSYIDTSPAGLSNPITFVQALSAQMRTRAGPTALNLPDAVRQINAVLDRIGAARIEPPSARTLGALRAYLATRWFISTRDQCLFQSATLFQFLARRGWQPRFVVAVRMAPFAAHAWVQAGEMVLNDRLDQVLPYTPILVL